MAYAIEFKNFTKKYKGRPEPAVKDVSFVVESGSFHGLIGANGSGKTTSIKSLIRAFVNYDGEILIDGISNSKSKAKELIGYIPEKADFPSGLSAKSYLFHMARLSDFSYKDAKKAANDLLDKFGMTNMAKKRPSSFSSGQKKKILLAQALIHNPKILIMDEPAANLDPVARREFFETLSKLNKEGITIFITSHILAELDEYIESATILDNGSVAFTGPLKEMKKTSNLVIELSTKQEVSEVEKLIKDKHVVINKTNDSITISLEKDGKIISEKEVMKPIVQKIIPQSYYVQNISLQDIYNKFAILGSVDSQEKTKKRWWNVKAN